MRMGEDADVGYGARGHERSAGRASNTPAYPQFWMLANFRTLKRSGRFGDFGRKSTQKICSAQAR